MICYGEKLGIIYLSIYAISAVPYFFLLSLQADLDREAEKDRLLKENEKKKLEMIKSPEHKEKYETIGSESEKVIEKSK